MTGYDSISLQSELDEHGPCVRVLITGHAGSTPRETGTSMLVWDGHQSGTIGGGALEFEAVKVARGALTIQSNQILKMPLGPALGQCCGGSVTLALEYINSASVDETFHARSITDDVTPSLAVQRTVAKLRNGQQAPSLQFIDGWLIEPITQAKQPIWIYGAGHVGRAIVDCLDGLPFDIHWVDTSQDRFPDNVNPDVNVLVARIPADVTSHAQTNAEHLILTYSHAMDLELCHRILSQPFKSLGLIGSATKIARFRSKLHDLGHTDTQIDRIICPIGDPALGKTPKAIALGISTSLMLDTLSQTTQKEARQ